MDDTSLRGYLSSFLLTTALLGSLASAVDLEYISPAQGQALADQFSNSSLGEEGLKAMRRHQTWTCDMYGMRTRIQVQRGVKLYAFKGPDETKKLRNSGAQPIEDYHLETDAVVGHNARIQDRIRFTREGQLISQLTSTNDRSPVIAYSICKPL